ncbi:MULTISPECIES: AMP-binding protein [Rhodopseudomonas]|uniref:Acyl carrier protein n=1 Tax=Rhodopseudomonas palustris TaxID=1076 RepID=A0A0D7EN09_RHOPL|nr:MULTISPECIES: AMP-binding protein [Rhodopseudomonas]KIZ40827.1 acyl carrier protein [Rhodopseudomonas palustris]MDF3812454.1 AMP-binding protein [Rhodopseudomonas sp. BAL398]WOK19453.1 AMP-binding protein [Rhodopseudomonas sp. BAL398]
MSDALDQYAAAADAFSTAPTLAEMPRRTLADKGIAGPTAAHVIEEIHTPFNLAYVTFTTGSSAFQNIVGVAHTEIEARCEATRRVMEAIGAKPGDRMFVTYPPLVNVFSKEALDRCGIEWFFLERSSRAAFISTFCRERPDIVLGESSFIRASLAEAKQLGLAADLPAACRIVVAGTPLDLDLLTEVAAQGYQVHDLYGCQEFGWLTLNGRPVRDDLSFVPSPAGDGFRELVVGGLPMGDSFPISESGHVCDPAGKVITYRRRRTYPEYEVVITKTPVASHETLDRAARTILRIKSRVVKIATDLQTSCDATELRLVPGFGSADSIEAAQLLITGPVATQALDDLVRAQMEVQSTSKTDPVWHKKR